MEPSSYRMKNFQGIAGNFIISLSFKDDVLQLNATCPESSQIFSFDSQTIEEITTKFSLSQENLYELFKNELSAPEKFQTIKIDTKGKLTFSLKMKHENPILITLTIQLNEKQMSEMEKLTKKCEILTKGFFEMRKLVALERKYFVPNGLYRIQSVSLEKYLSVQNYSKEKTSFLLNNYNSLNDPIVQNFFLERQLDGSYKIILQHSGKVMEIELDSKEQKVQQGNFQNSDNQYWFLQPIEEGNFYIISKSNNAILTALDIGSVIIQNNSYEKNKSLLFKLIPENLPSNGQYHIKGKSGSYLKVQEYSLKNCIPILHGKKNHPYCLKQNNEGFFKIMTPETDKVLDVDGESEADDAQIIQYTHWRGHNQQWRIVEFMKGYYFIIARHSGKLLTLLENEVVRQREKYKDENNIKYQLFSFDK